MRAFYTHAMWRVQPGRVQEFTDAWKEMAKAFSAIPGAPATGTLIQSLDDEHVFYSFGPWDSLEQIHAMRQDTSARAALERTRALCTQATPGSYRVIAHVG